MKLKFLALALLAGFSLSAQQNANTISAKKYIGKDISRSKKNNTKKNILTATAYTGFTYICYRYFDAAIKKNVQASVNPFISSVSKTIGHAGLGTTQLAIIFTTGLTGIIAKNKYLQKAAIVLSVSHALNDFVTNQAKITFQRHRPGTGDAENDFDWRDGPKKNTSFISSHTSNAFCTATVFADCFPDKKWIKIAAYSLATLVGLSRIYDNAHWTSDVLAGAAVGFLSAKTMGKLYSFAEKRVSFLPMVNNGHYSFIMAVSFK